MQENAPELIFLDDDGETPNHPRLPVLLFRGAVPPGAPEAAEALFARHGWPPAWRDGIFPWLHYHPDAHEALAFIAGEARVQLGGASGPLVHLRAGDVAVLPAGTGHQNCGASPDLLVVGAYPDGQDPSTWRAAPGDHARAGPVIARVAVPPADPVRGAPWPART